jgi:hypothetical protein
VIDQVLQEEFNKVFADKSRAQQNEKSKSGHFNDIVFDARKWRSIKDLMMSLR